jgi:hypothetical protein
MNTLISTFQFWLHNSSLLFLIICIPMTDCTCESTSKCLIFITFYLREPRGIEMGPRASSAWRGVRRLCGMHKFTTNPSCGWDVNNATGLETRKGDGYGRIILPVQQVSYGPLIMSIMLIMSCSTGFFNVQRGWQSLNTGPQFYLRLIRRTGWLFYDYVHWH